MTNGFELAVERHFDVPPAAVWTAWTDHLTEWWCPRPWTTEIIANDMRAGGAASFVMHGPAGETSAMPGVYLEVTAPTRIVFTNAFTAGWIPNAPFMTGVFTFEPRGSGTTYRAAARHWDEATCKQHEAMGFQTGWGLVTGQLSALAETAAKG